MIMALIHILLFVALLPAITKANISRRNANPLSSPLPSLPSLDKFLGDSSGSLVGDFKINDQCSAKASKVDTTYQISSNPVNCMNLAILLEKILPSGKGNFDMGDFMVLHKITIRSLSFNTATKEVDIVAAYTGSVSIVPGLISLSDVRMQLLFTSSRSDKWRFDISASITIGAVVIDVNILRNEDGYYLSASSKDTVRASDISHLFQTKNSFLPENGLEKKLTDAKFDSFAILDPRVRATFAEGYGFLFGGQIRILNWELFDVNLVLNKPNDHPIAVTIAVFIPNFSLAKMLNDLFSIDISSVPVIGTADARNLGLIISTQDVETPLALVDIGFQDIFDLPYRKGIKASFEILIVDVYVKISVLITPTELRLTVSQPGELTLGKVIQAFLPNEGKLVSGAGANSKLVDWPNFILNPLKISLTLFDVAAAKDAKGWSMSSLKINLKMTKSIVLFNNLITISDLEFDMAWSKANSVSGLIAGTVTIGSNEKASPKVDIRIPFPFKNQEITFTFTNFNIHSVASTFDFSLPTQFPNLLAQIQLDRIALAFNGAGKLDKVTVHASIPQVWHLFGSFSIGNVQMTLEANNLAGGGSGNKVVRISGNIIISSCTIFVSAVVGSNEIKIKANGANCAVSISDILNKIHVNPSILPSLITGFTLSDPVFSLTWDPRAKTKSIGFGATTSLFGNSDAEVALISSGGKTAVVAAFAVQSSSNVPGISFLSDLGLTNLAVIFVSQRIRLTPYQWGKPVFKKYAPENGEQANGLTIYASFTPSNDNLMGKLLKEAGQSSIIVKLTIPDFIFQLDINLGPNGIPLKGGGKFISMGLVISKRLIGLNLKFALQVKDAHLKFTGELTFTFGGTATISLLMEGEWKNPLGIQHFSIYRLGLALGINVETLLPSFGLTGAVRVTPPSRNPIDASITLCFDTADPSTTVLEIHFSRLLLQDIVNTFAGKPVSLPKQVGEMGFPDEVHIYVSPAGNDRCFGKKYEAGVEVNGVFQIPFLNIRAKAYISVKLTSFHLKADLEMDPINYGNGLLRIVSAQSNNVGPYLKMNIGSSSDFLISGSCRIVLFGASISIRLEINKQKLFFEGRLNLWNLFQVHVLVELQYTARSPSLHIIGEMQNDLFTKIKQRAVQGIRNGARAINQKISAAQQKITNAQNEVNRLNGYIRYHQRKINEAKNECRRAPWYKKYICIGTGFKIVYHGGIIATLWISEKVAVGVLEAAKWFLEGVKGIIKVGAEVLSALVNAALSIIDIKYIKFEEWLTSTRKTFDFNAKITVLGWTFTLRFSINFSNSYTANHGINGVGDQISSNTLSKVKK